MNGTRIFLVVLAVGVILGLAMAGTDLFNPVRSPAEAALLEASVTRIEGQNAINLQQQAQLTKAETEIQLETIELDMAYRQRLLDGDVKLQQQLNEQERQWAAIWNVVGLVLTGVIVAVLCAALFMFSLAGAQRLAGSRPRPVRRVAPEPVARPVDPARPAMDATRPAAAQVSPVPPATACANPPRQATPPGQPSQPPAGLDPNGPRGAQPNGRQPQDAPWTAEQRRDAILQARQQEQNERMLKILIDGRMERINGQRSY